jgi:predicted N-formylglutamate amidohydrolase
LSQVSIEASHENVSVVNAAGSSSVVLVCEHASGHIPDTYKGLGLSQADRMSHAAWDPGAMSVAQNLSKRLDAVLVASRVSRLVYDCNRPPDAVDAMPSRSEIIEVPGNRDLSQSERKARIAEVYLPFRAELQRVIRCVAHPVVVTVHSFTPVYHGELRPVEIGILHDSDPRLADAMLGAEHGTHNVQRNEPYGPENGVTHTLKEHAIRAGHLNVMLEIRNDLIETAAQQAVMADVLTNWLVAACAEIGVEGDVRCHA